MQSVLESPVAATDSEAAPTMAGGAEAWSRLCAALDEQSRLQARIVALAGRVQRSGTIERIEGLTLDASLSVTHRLTQADRSMLLTAADVLADMPATRRLFETAVLSWSQVRGIVAEARRLPKEQRAILDAHIAASQKLFTKMDPDDALDAVRVVVQELRDARAAKRSEEAQARGNFFYGQPGMFDRGRVYGEMDNLSLAAVLAGVDGAVPPDDGRSVGQRRADGLIALATHRCDDDAAAATPDGVDGSADGDHDGRDSRRGSTRHPLIGKARGDFVALIDYRDVWVNAAGMLQINAPGCLPTVSAALLEALAGDASVRAVLMDGARPLTATKKVRATQLPRDVRLAVMARDRADRFPGSRRSIAHVHHANRKGEGHHVDFLAGLSDASHWRVHNRGWKVTLDPPTGEMTFTRGDRSWTTLPRGTRLRRPPPPGEPPPDG